MMLAIALATRNCNMNNLAREIKDNELKNNNIKRTLMKNKYFSFIVKRSLYLKKNQKQNII
jgi:hypothetical protein